ncbi:hypothetical protein E4U51_000319 [Claviceps purpurea]|nr:hypothetical protein E4U51_000319 [Claviceps purpurea]
MADGTTNPPTAATGRVTRSTAQAAGSPSSASHDTAAYLTRDMLPDRLSRFADYVTAAWQDRRTIINQHSTTLDIDNKLAYLYNYYVEHGKTHEMLRRTFCEDCEDWTIHTWEKASFRPRQEMRDLLEVNGIYVGKGSGSKIAENLLRVVSIYMCDDDDGESEQPKGAKTDLHFNEQGDLVTDDGNDRSATLSYQIYRQQTEVADTTAKFEAAQLVTRELKQQSSAHFINEDPSVDLREGSGSDDTFHDDPVKQKGEEEEILPEGSTPCERTHSQENLELSPRKALAVSHSREILATTDFAMSWNALLITTPLISLLGDFVSHYRLVARLIP